MLNVLYNYLMIFANTVFIFFLLKAVGKGEYTEKRAWLFLGINTVVIGSLYNLLINTISFIPIIAIAVYIVSSKLVLENSWYESFVGVGLFYILSGIGEAICYYVFVQSMGYSVDYVRDTLLLNFLVQVAAYINVLLLLIGLKFAKKKRPGNSNIKKNIILFICMVLVIMMINFICLKFSTFNDNYIIPMNIVFMSVFVVISVIYIMVMQILLVKNQENEDLKRYISTIDELSNELRRFKHNYLNILYGFAGYIENEEWDKLKDYYYDIVDESKTINNNVFVLQKVRNSALFGLVSQKLNKAKEVGVTLQLEALNNIEDVILKNTDICEVLGVYLDNAIEATIDTSEKTVVLEMISDDHFIEFIVRNGFNENPDLQQINNKGYTTKRGDNRGIGLYTAKEILDKYDNVLLNTYVDKGKFVQELIINKRD